MLSTRAGQGSALQAPRGAKTKTAVRALPSLSGLLKAVNQRLTGRSKQLQAADPVTETIIRTEEAGADAFSTGGRASASSSAAAAAGLPAGRSKGGRGRSSIRMEVRVVDSISKVPQHEWDAVVRTCSGGEVNPTLLWSFLHAMEESGSACPRTGWLPQHVIVRELPGEEADSDSEPAAAAAATATAAAAAGVDSERQASGASASTSASLGAPGAAASRGRLLGCVPMYLKGHSYGEYVFDSSWADFASRLGLRYYPKLQAAVPFTPVTGSRLLVAGELGLGERAAVVRALGRALISMADQSDISGVHLTFTTGEEWAALAELGFKQRLGLQFHWDNPGYESFDAFLADLKQSKRKSIRQERKSIEKAGLAVHRLRGGELTAAHWDRFYEFYLSTVDRKWGNAYLTRDFFQQLGATMPDQVLLVAATDAGVAVPSPGAAPEAQSLVAAALNLVGSHALFGRNWGVADGRDVKNLHFELCYYQALDEAIQRRLPRVEAGAQGEHKLQRGYLPSLTYSCHYIRDPRLGAAVDKFLSRERGQIEYALQVMSLTASPYKQERTMESLVRKVNAYSSLSSSSSSSDSLDEELAAAALAAELRGN
ncbi:hypothetical protein CHLRE_09g399626v5 [Chlamydomonas reinhardtii]|uniref:Uncharacterized protein n=1 Tax=Chlamydomonas reinhardtii TaxID=3055 RepID=A0A2K3DEW2_CHLRE|nr:uncharacterized protein CHLRE_09g399626v5 [Chlamydomonas reinhardtii]PNW79069.1 hypothetical protein CHLRE_09g399626v5 [Chlamydomonas reinhardtii]